VARCHRKGGSYVQAATQALRHLAHLLGTESESGSVSESEWNWISIGVPATEDDAGSLHKTIGSDISLTWPNPTIKNRFQGASRRVSSRDARFMRLAFTRIAKVEDIGFY